MNAYISIGWISTAINIITHLIFRVNKPKGLMRNKVYRINEVILSFAKAQKQRIAALFNAFCNAGKGQKNKFKCKVYFVSNPLYAICCTAQGKSKSVVMRGNFVEP